MSGTSSWPAAGLLVLGLLLLVVPGASGSVFAGPPLSLAGRVVLAGLATAAVALWIFRMPRLPRWAFAVLALLLGAKVGLAVFDQPSGWSAQVYRDASPETPESFFWRFGERSYRIDPSIAFEGATFGLHFLNDIHYNSGVYKAVRRDESLGWRVHWRGYVTGASGHPLTGEVSAAGLVVIEADGVEVVRATDPSNVGFAVDTVAAGPVRVDVTYRKPAGLVPAIRVDWDEGDLLRVATDEAAATGVDRQRRRSTATSVVVAGGVSLIAWLLGAAAWCRPRPRWGASRLAAAAVVVGVAGLASGAVAIGERFSGKTYHMSEGNDPLVYEGHARDIMAHGPLMLAGAPLGEARPYFHYPLYPHVVAGLHWVIGEDAASVMFGNGLMVAMVLPLLWVLGWHRLPPGASIVALGAAALVIGRHALPYTVEVFTDNLFLPLVFVGLTLGAWAARSNRATAWLLAGASIALGAATRPSLLTYLPFLLVAVALAGGRRDWKWSARAAALLLAGFGAAVLPFTLRNYYVSGQLVMLVNSWVGLAVFLVPPGESYAFIYSGRPLGLRESAWQAIQLLLDHPGRTIELELRKLFFTFGFTNLAPAQGLGLRPEFVAAAGAGVFALLRGVVERPVLIVTAAFAVSHVVAMVLAAPWTYGYKSILPIQILFLFWAGLLTTRAGRWAT